MAEKPDTPFGEDLAVIQEIDLQSLEQLFPKQLDDDFKEKIRRTTNYQQTASVRQNFIQKHISKSLDDQQIINPPHAPVTQEQSKERMIWVILLATSLLTIGGLLRKLGRKKIKK